MKLSTFAAVLCTAIVCSVSAFAQTDTTFTYQGELMESGSPADGTYSMDFLLYDALSGGSQVGSTITIAAQSVSDGIFSAQLDFGVQDFSGSQHWLEIIVDGSTLTPRQPMTASPFSIQTRGVYVDDSGNVGIGNTSPTAQLHVGTGDGEIVLGQSPQLIIRRDVANSRFQMLVAGTGFVGKYLQLGRDDFNQDIVMMGDVGVGTNTPTSRLHVEATSGDATFSRTTSNTGKGVYGIADHLSGINYGVYGESSSSQGVGVYGRSSSFGGNSRGVVGESLSPGGTGVRGIALSDSGNTTGVVGLCYSPDGKGMQGTSLATTGFGSGVVGFGSSPTGYDFLAAGPGINYGSNSSIRWKSNIVNIDNPLDKISQLRGVYYDWDEEHGGQHAIGMIAEEVGKVLPEIVGYEENGVDAIGMDYSMLTPLLVESVNALRAEKDTQIKQLRHENKLLKARLDRLEQMMLRSTD